MQSTSHHPQRRRIVSYAPRHGRLTPGQRHAWDRNWVRLGKHLADLPEGPLDTAAWFGRVAPVILEIGSGMGESTAAMAVQEPELDHLAVEVYRPGLAQLLLRVEHAGLTNLRLLCGDAYQLLTEQVAAGSLHGVRIYFPDPWPKKRHHKRRLVHPEFVALVAARLVPGGTLHLATDWEPYAEEMLAACSGEPTLRNVAADAIAADAVADAGLEPLPAGAGFVARPSWRPVSKFEQRALNEGRVVRDLLFTRVVPA